MSGFEGNKFGGQNPDFFSPPAGTGVTSQSRSGLGLEDYNPFADQQAANNMGEPLPQGTMTVGGDVGSSQLPHQPTIAELQRRQEELDRKAAELAEREEALRNGTFNARANNWPPLPKICPVQPCFYQDIGVDIPLEFQKIVRTMYYLWVFYVMILLINFLSSTVLLFFGIEDGGKIFGMGLVTTAVFVPASFVCWFRPLYKAFRSDSSFNFMVFFFVFFAQLVVSVICAVGLGSTTFGAFGFIDAISQITKNAAIGIIEMIIASLHAVFAVASAFMLMRVHRLYRGTGASFAKAQAEFASGVLRNEHVQNAAANVAAEAARTAVQQNMNQGGNRY